MSKMTQMYTGKWQEGAGVGSVQAQSQHCNQSLLEWEAPQGEKP